MAREIIDDVLLGALHIQSLTRDGFHHDHAVDHEAFQIGTLDALMEGRFDGDTTLGELLQHGSMGLGTVQHLGGELIIDQGKAYVARHDGSVVRVPETMKTPFAVVTAFQAAETVNIGDVDSAELFSVLTSLTGEHDEIVAVRLSGLFHDLVLRSIEEQHPPYVPLSTVIESQHEFTRHRCSGTIVGFRFPDYLAGLEVPGFHLHFLSDKKDFGGHVMALGIESATLEFEASQAMHVELPDGVTLGAPGTADRSAIRAIEEGD